LPLKGDGKMEYKCECGREGSYDENYVAMCPCGKKLKPLKTNKDTGAKLACSDVLPNLIIWVDKLQDTAEQSMEEYKAQEQQFYGEKLACLKFKRHLMKLMVG
jgi:hypothetical protein